MNIIDEKYTTLFIVILFPRNWVSQWFLWNKRFAVACDTHEKKTSDTLCIAECCVVRTGVSVPDLSPLLDRVLHVCQGGLVSRRRLPQMCLLKNYCKIIRRKEKLMQIISKNIQKFVMANALHYKCNATWIHLFHHKYVTLFINVYLPNWHVNTEKCTMAT